MKQVYFLAILLTLPFASTANPIVLHQSHDFLWFWGVADGFVPLWYAISIAILGLTVEYIFLRITLGIKEPKIENIGLKFLTINSVTFPLTQVFTYFVGPVSELFPVIVEKIYYNRSTRFKECGLKGWVFVAISNLLSWTVGYYAWDVYNRFANTS